jgi:hypothetical protein
MPRTISKRARGEDQHQPSHPPGKPGTPKNGAGKVVPIRSDT